MTKELAIIVLEDCIESLREVMENAPFEEAGYAMLEIQAHRMAIKALRRRRAMRRDACPRCYELLSKNWNFCPDCGRSIEGKAKTAKGYV